MARFDSFKALHDSIAATREAREEGVLRLAAQIEADDDRIAAHTCRTTIHEWIASRVPGKLPEEATDHGTFDIRHGAIRCQAVRVLREDNDFWAVRLRTPDPSAPAEAWVTETGVGWMPGSPPVFHLRLLRSSNGAGLRPLTPKVPDVATRLASVLELRQFGEPVTGTAWTVGSNADADWLCARLTDSGRGLPIVALSVPDDADDPHSPLIEPDALARACIGLATVVVIPAEFAWRLTDRFGRRHSVYQGAVRIYNPGFHPNSSEWDHRLFLGLSLSNPSGIELTTNQILDTVAEMSLERQAEMPFKEVQRLANEYRTAQAPTEAPAADPAPAAPPPASPPAAAQHPAAARPSAAAGPPVTPSAPAAPQPQAMPQPPAAPEPPAASPQPEAIAATAAAPVAPDPLPPLGPVEDRPPARLEPAAGARSGLPAADDAPAERPFWARSVRSAPPPRPTPEARPPTTPRQRTPPEPPERSRTYREPRPYPRVGAPRLTEAPPRASRAADRGRPPEVEAPASYPPASYPDAYPDAAPEPQAAPPVTAAPQPTAAPPAPISPQPPVAPQPTVAPQPMAAPQPTAAPPEPAPEVIPAPQAASPPVPTGFFARLRYLFFGGAKKTRARALPEPRPTLPEPEPQPAPEPAPPDPAELAQLEKDRRALQVRAADLERLLDRAEQEKAKYSDELDDARERADDAERRFDLSISQQQALADRLRDLGEDPEPEAPLPTEWSQFNDWCETRLAGRVLLTPRAHREVKRAQFGDVPLAARCLLWLANDFRDRRMGRQPEDRRETVENGVHNARCGGDAFSVKWRGKNRRVDWHLKSGGSTHDPKRCLRIYYFWDSARNQAIVASMPAHIRTAAT